MKESMEEENQWFFVVLIDQLGLGYQIDTKMADLIAEDMILQN